MIASGQSERAALQRTRHGGGPVLALGVLLCVVAAARAQQMPTEAGPAAQSQPAAAPETAPPAAPQPPRQDGLFGTIGRWIDGSVARVGTVWRGKPEALQDERRKNIVIELLPKTKIVSGRERCETAANGAPDCRGAVEALCRSKGLAGGNSLDVQSAEKCPTRVWISGAQPTAGECRMESYVQRAFCQ